MIMEFNQLVHYFISLLVICSPFSALPALLGMTQGLSVEEKRHTGLIAGIAVGVILLLMTWIGSDFLSFLGISLPSFQVAGGVVVFLLALSMLNAETSRMKQTTEDQKATKRKESIAIVPLAIPLMAGPGAISTVIVSVGNFPGVVNQVYMSICAVFVALVLGLTLYSASRLEKMIGYAGINIINRLAGLILAAMAVEMLAKGASGLFPFLGHH